jgi:hypothetical protein
MADGRENQQAMAERLARERIAIALTKMERAQILIFDAAAELSPILGMVKQWERVCKLGEKCRENWYALERDQQKKSFLVDECCLQYYSKQMAGEAPQNEQVQP